VGRNGTVVSFPQAEQLVVVSTRSLAITAPGAGRDARLALQLLHRLGSFLKFLSAKNNCSPAVQMNSVPQSTHVSDLSWNSIGPYLSPLDRPHRGGDPSVRQPSWPPPGRIRYPLRLVRLAALLFARAFSRKRLLGATPVAGLQVERVLLDILDDIFLLNLPLESAQRALDGLAFLHFDFSQT
jgi:hypothetical protein